MARDSLAMAMMELMLLQLEGMSQWLTNQMLING